MPPREDGLDKRLSLFLRSDLDLILSSKRLIKRFPYGMKFLGSCLKNTDTKEAGRNAERSLKTCTNITRKQRKARLEDKMVSATGTSANSKLSMEKPAIQTQSQKAILRDTVFDFIP